MSSLDKRKQAFIKLGEYLSLLTDSLKLDNELSNFIGELDLIRRDKILIIHQNILEYIQCSTHNNPWFTKIFLENSIRSIAASLTLEKMNIWLETYEPRIDSISNPKTIGVVMAGNLPLVGFHDYLCVLISGHKLLAKLSKDDSKLLPLIHQVLELIEPELENKAVFSQEILKNFDAIIATGSNNTARYFEYYFGKYPNIIRKNRNGIAILNGHENTTELECLADDIFMYFGLGCRNVSKLFVPKGYNFEKLFFAFEKYSYFSNHNKYANNYDYNKSIYLINKTKYLDNGFIMLKEDTLYSSPISVVYYEYYDNLQDLNKQLVSNINKIQCLVSNEPIGNFNYLLSGKAQQPELWDYADGINTLEFILGIENQ